MTDNDARGNANELEEDRQAAEGGPVPGRDGGPINEDDMAAADGLQTPKDAADTYEDMLERGAQQKGEGRLP
jgi:hypothetical protein